VRTPAKWHHLPRKTPSEEESSHPRLVAPAELSGGATIARVLVSARGLGRGTCGEAGEPAPDDVVFTFVFCLEGCAPAVFEGVPGSFCDTVAEADYLVVEAGHDTVAREIDNCGKGGATRGASRRTILRKDTILTQTGTTNYALSTTFVLKKSFQEILDNTLNLPLQFWGKLSLLGNLLQQPAFITP
jgi:hypothetical protein